MSDPTQVVVGEDTYRYMVFGTDVTSEHWCDVRTGIIASPQLARALEACRVAEHRLRAAEKALRFYADAGNRWDKEIDSGNMARDYFKASKVTE